ncbi:2-hydroxyacid dehydrogenase [filamentous cyanobacterium LEGE 11480]|uniref:2-hydroxyacid dehydrogenase n=1 Tax=Romeriopsis navalis LEGE 11480 TaxID=2777977 RepID=A0A928Z434_9CYAN|nr:2-hydroxyacid dehydrogenase [Romeriopsis navalis]MBE9029913.1 2-hydroxyacid dehydrogenase [Romeriopsis navalis LEGE 11480]
MKIAVFSTKPYDRQFFDAANQTYNYDLTFFETKLTQQTASLAQGFTTVCIFVNDEPDDITLEILARNGTRILALRCAGFNNVDLAKAAALDLQVVRVPAYSPYAVAEHTFGLILTLNRKIHRAHNRVREGNFALEGLLGYDLHNRTIGIIGTGRIGQIVAQIANGFGLEILAYDLHENADLTAIGVKYVPLDQLLTQSHIITLHCPLTPDSHHLIDDAAITNMKQGVMLVNTSRGGLIDTQAVIKGLKSEKIGALALDVYEQESDLFFEDLSDRIIQDDIFQRLTTFPNVLITAHQAFFTEDAMQNIAETTLANINDLDNDRICPNLVQLPATS